ncbi:MAG: dihydrolipoyl dehydrogenase [Alphaproteobacteria bacterium]|nr:dihydrolipoyl dehydrogenase [Alphaproteobacteria bacterium]
MATSYDLIVIGTGPAGYVCAIRASQLGMKVAVVEKRSTHGGTCLNVGCIPSKALLYVSEIFQESKETFPYLGVGTGKPELNLNAMMKHRDEVVNANVQGIGLLLKKNKIDQFRGTAKILEQGNVRVTPEKDHSFNLNAQNIVIATGSESISLKGINVDEKRVVTSTGALNLSKVPESLLIIGAGVIGLELGSVWQRLGADVSIVDVADHILPGMDKETVKTFQSILIKQGIHFKMSSKVTSVESDEKTNKVSIKSTEGDKKEFLQADIVLLAIGRRPYTHGLGLEDVGVLLDEKGRVRIDAFFKTNIDGIYAIGDVIAGPMLAHKAADEGVALAEIIAGQAGNVNYNVIPNVIYTMPEVAGIGKTEEELKENGIDYAKGKFPLTANGRARAMHKTNGNIKILTDKKTDRVLGAHMISHNAGDLIHEVAVLMEFGGSAEDLARTCHAHPTLSEAVREAALNVNKSAIHM